MIAYAINDEVFVESYPSREIVNTFGEHVSSLAMSPDGTTLAIVGHKTLKLYDILTGDLVYSMNSKAFMYSMVFGDDGTLTLAYYGVIEVLNALRFTSSRIKVNLVHKLSPNGRFACVTNRDDLELIDVHTKLTIAKLIRGLGIVNVYVDFSSNGEVMAVSPSSGDTRTVRLFSITGHPLGSVHVNSPYFMFRLNYDGQDVYTIDNRGTMSVLDTATGEIKRSVPTVYRYHVNMVVLNDGCVILNRAHGLIMVQPDDSVVSYETTEPVNSDSPTIMAVWTPTVVLM
jgi:WD40 repeat protein